jgi:putative endonuclease
MNTSQKGRLGEEIAQDFLIKKGYQILEKNYRYKRSEIDLIALYNGTVIFIEVKLRKNENFGFPEEFVSKRKEELVKEAAENYVFEKNWLKNIRFDIISIIKTTFKEEIIHLEDAF